MPPPFVSREWALILARRAQAGEYIDGHCSVFTARSLLVLLDGLLALGLLPFSMERFHIAEVGTAEMSLVLRHRPGNADQGVARGEIQAMLQAGADSEGLPLDTPAPQCTDTQTAALASRLAELERALATLRASTSWKLTRPLRAVVDTLKARRA